MHQALEHVLLKISNPPYGTSQLKKTNLQIHPLRFSTKQKLFSYLHYFTLCGFKLKSNLLFNFSFISLYPLPLLLQSFSPQVSCSTGQHLFSGGIVLCMSSVAIRRNGLDERCFSGPRTPSPLNDNNSTVLYVEVATHTHTHTHRQPKSTVFFNKQGLVC
ncbi:hypothetical protein ATANTOWER_024651 [Ataeniobius toweri]|uniref:Uncharacterized protein n=1 Tax=Ataeniobius toweri TaxID=208326 RepID=A0ABU7C9A1_9TELE|nr:hypothetical protein [Ataeniobius toweri]